MFFFINYYLFLPAFVIAFAAALLLSVVFLFFCGFIFVVFRGHGDCVAILL